MSLNNIKADLVTERMITSQGYKWNLRDNYSESRQDFEKRMIGKGYSVQYPRRDQLFIDIDSEEQYQQFLLMFNRFKVNFQSITFKEEPSNSGLPRRHVYVSLGNKISPIERIALQAIFGSDPVRELLSYFRYLSGDNMPTLFCKKGKK